MCALSVTTSSRFRLRHVQTHLPPLLSTSPCWHTRMLLLQGHRRPQKPSLAVLEDLRSKVYLSVCYWNFGVIVKERTVSLLPSAPQSILFSNKATKQSPSGSQILTIFKMNSQMAQIPCLAILAMEAVIINLPCCPISLGRACRTSTK